jgi:hypothetical protein
LEPDLVHVGQASARFVGIPQGTVEVRSELAAPAIQTWGFIKAEETLRVFLLYIFNTIEDDFNNR